VPWMFMSNRLTVVYSKFDMLCDRSTKLGNR
jgi:hypothetical protein